MTNPPDPAPLQWPSLEEAIGYLDDILGGYGDYCIKLYANNTVFGHTVDQHIQRIPIGYASSFSVPLDEHTHTVRTIVFLCSYDTDEQQWLIGIEMDDGTEGFLDDLWMLSLMESIKSSRDAEYDLEGDDE